MEDYSKHCLQAGSTVRNVCVAPGRGLQAVYIPLVAFGTDGL